MTSIENELIILVVFIIQKSKIEENLTGLFVCLTMIKWVVYLVAASTTTFIASKKTPIGVYRSRSSIALDNLLRKFRKRNDACTKATENGSKTTNATYMIDWNRYKNSTINVTTPPKCSVPNLSCRGWPWISFGLMTTAATMIVNTAHNPRMVCIGLLSTNSVDKIAACKINTNKFLCSEGGFSNNKI